MIDIPFADLPAIHRPTIADIQRATCEIFQLSPQDMTSGSRYREVARPRQAAMYLARELTLRSLPEIGRHFGGRDHTTVLFGIRATVRRIEDDPEAACNIALIAARAAHFTAERAWRVRDFGLYGTEAYT